MSDEELTNRIHDLENKLDQLLNTQKDLLENKSDLVKVLKENKLDILEGLDYIGEKARDMLLVLLLMVSAWAAYNNLETSQKNKLSSDYLNTLLGGGAATALVYRLFKNKEEKDNSTQKIQRINEDIDMKR